MGPAQQRPALAGFRDTVSELTRKGLSLGDVEGAINSQPALTEDQKASLWVFAFALRDRSDRERQVRALSAVVQAALGVESHAGATDHARPREFDSRGFPIPQRSRSFIERVARLLNPE
jgi:hypothetical protein